MNLLRLVVFLCLTTALGAAQRPNFIFILTDDHRWDSLGCAGHPVLQTPHIDALAARGVTFTSHCVTTSICNVSRASILTGQYLRRHGKVGFGDPFTPEEWARTYPAQLRAAGYRTGFIGKFGVGNEKAIAAMEKEFDYWRGLPGQGGLFFDKENPGLHKTALMGNQALEFIGGASKDQPFCLSISFNAPHARDRQPREFWPDARDEALYADAVIPAPRLSGGEWLRALPESAQKGENHARWGWRFSTPEDYQRNMKDYYRLISGIDREVGRLTEKLTASGLAENTVIIFTGDNGFFHGERGLADKWLMYEESIRVPAIIMDPRAPAEKRGRKEPHLTLNIDFAPTMLAMAGVPVPPQMQGTSLLPALEGEKAEAWRQDFFYEHRTLPARIPPVEGVRGMRWKYTRWTATEPVFEELYDLKSDPGEEKNLAPLAEHAAMLQTMRTRCDELKKQAE